MPTSLSDLIGHRVTLEGHFAGVVRIEDVEPLGEGAHTVRVRAEDGSLHETLLTGADLEDGVVQEVGETAALVPGEDFFDFIEAHRIELAFTHDPTFAVSLSGIRGLPHQIVAVYKHMLPQARLRFVLADDPGSGKTIMAGLLMKELHLRGVADRILVLCPAPLTVQWQDELRDKFDETFKVIDSHEVTQQLAGNPWQQNDRCIASVDFSKRDEVLPDLLLADWDLVVVDEAHKCAAVSRWSQEEQRERLDRTKRYALAEELASRCERLLLMTATPHSGDSDRFQNFLRLLDPDQFSIEEITRKQIGRGDSPYFLRRMKEDLCDETGAPLFQPREVHRQPFHLSASELRLYEDVTDYIKEFLGQTGGRRGNAIALARTVLQRRLASSLGAIRSSLHKRAARITAKIDEVEALSPAERQQRLAEMSLLEDFDDEREDDDATEQEQDAAASGVVVAETLDAMRTEVRRLRELVAQTDRAMATETETKLTKLKETLDSTELRQLKEDGRAKLLVFTEHRDTLDYLERHFVEWGYDVCTIHGGFSPVDRKQIQQQFHQEKQVCIATEAAGEGINLQFCHLMINYDLPWNPVRLEQRMGRIHRIGQEKTCVIFNLYAANTIEGELIDRLLVKLEEMKEALSDRVYDVVGEVLDLNGLDFERLLRDTLLNPKLRERSGELIEEMTAAKLSEYEDLVGIAQAKRNVDMAWVDERQWASEERRLMPEYVERFFGRACRQLELRFERRPDGLWRMDRVPAPLRSDRLASVKRLGRPLQSYRKLTFLKSDRDRPQHEDAVLLSPGHTLFASISESLRSKLEGFEGACAPFVAPWATDPYPIHFFAYRVNGLSTRNQEEEVYAELVAVAGKPGALEVVPADVVHDLTVVDYTKLDPPGREEIKEAMNFVRLRVQHPIVEEQRRERLEQARLRSDYLNDALDAQRAQLELKWSELNDRVYRGEEKARLALDGAQSRLRAVDDRREDKLTAFEQLGIVRPGPVAHIGTALVGPPQAVAPEEADTMRSDKDVELAAMAWAMAYEREAGWDPEDVSDARDGSGFDIRSVRRESGRVADVRRIEVKGRSGSGGDVALCNTEWIAAQRHQDDYWLYVVYGAVSDSPRGVTIQNPARVLGDQIREHTSVTTWFVPAAAIEAAA